MAVEKTIGINSYQQYTYRKSSDSNVENRNAEEMAAESGASGKQAGSLERVPINIDMSTGNDRKIDNDKTEAYANDQQVLHERIQKSIENYSSRMGNFEAKFGVHEETNRVMIKLVDKDTKEVLKEIPPEKTLDMIAKCLEMAGMLVDEKR